MSLLDDARLAATRYDNQRTRWAFADRGEGTILECASCQRPVHAHAADCVFVLMPRIVKVLEAVENVARAYDQETVATFGTNLGSPLLHAVDALDKAFEG